VFSFTRKLWIKNLLDLSLLLKVPFTCPQVMMNFGDEFLRKLGKEVFKQKEKKSKLKSKWHHLRGSQSLKKASIQGQLYV